MADISDDDDDTEYILPDGRVAPKHSLTKGLLVSLNEVLSPLHGVKVSDYRQKLPDKILFRVIDCIADERSVFGPFGCPVTPRDVVDRLEAISLTCRELRTPAQMALGQWAHVIVSNGISPSRHSPHLGCWTRQLVVEFEILPWTPDEVLQASINYISSVLKRTCYLRELYLRATDDDGAGSYGVTEAGFRRIALPKFSLMRQLGCQAITPLLEHLWWSSAENLDPQTIRMDVEELCLVAQHFPMMKELTAQMSSLGATSRMVWPDGNTEHIHNVDVEAFKPLKLETLTLVRVSTAYGMGELGHDLPPLSITCLKCLFGTGTLRRLTLDITDFQRNVGYTLSVLSVLADCGVGAIETLRLRIGTGPASSSARGKELNSLPRLFSGLVKLKYLQIWLGSSSGIEGGQPYGDWDSYFDFSMRMTGGMLEGARGCSTLEHVCIIGLHLLGRQPTAPGWKILEEIIMSALQLESSDLTSNISPPSLKRLEIGLLQDLRKDMYEFATLASACSERGCELLARSVGDTETFNKTYTYL